MTCPGCRQDVVPVPITFTWWGGVLGPRLLSHVRCPGCSTRFNGKTGAANTTAIAIYLVIVGLVSFALVYYVLQTL